uniref:Similar to n=1 Tax=Panagrellus redivivus TaxID=6233 RepID=A0A7E4WDF3_PANRE
MNTLPTTPNPSTLTEERMRQMLMAPRITRMVSQPSFHADYWQTPVKSNFAECQKDDVFENADSGFFEASESEASSSQNTPPATPNRSIMTEQYVNQLLMAPKVDHRAAPWYSKKGASPWNSPLSHLYGHEDTTNSPSDDDAIEPRQVNALEIGQQVDENRSLEALMVSSAVRRLFPPRETV